jgi:hypothetical protein
MDSEKLIEVLDSDNASAIEKEQDNKVVAINILRSKIPYEKCPRIIQAAEHDMVYLCDIDEAAPYLDLKDALELNDLGVFHDEETGSMAIWA